MREKFVLEQVFPPHAFRCRTNDVCRTMMYMDFNYTSYWLNNIDSGLCGVVHSTNSGRHSSNQGYDIWPVHLCATPRSTHTDTLILMTIFANCLSVMLFSSVEQRGTRNENEAKRRSEKKLYYIIYCKFFLAFELTSRLRKATMELASRNRIGRIVFAVVAIVVVLFQPSPGCWRQRNETPSTLIHSAWNPLKIT